MLLRKYSVVLSSEPGCTNLIKHNVLTSDDIPVRQRPYRIPQVMRDTVKAELDKMLMAGYIEPANSPYGSPIVIRLGDFVWTITI